MTAWYANEEFWRDGYELMFSAEAFRTAACEVDPMLALVGFQPRRVLDLCCGPGRHAISFAKRGYQATGVDLSAFLLERAQENASAAGVQPEFVREDMRSFTRPGAFELVLSLWTSFGYFEDADHDVTVLRNVFESLRPGGAFLLDVAGKELFGRRGDRVVGLRDGSICVQRMRITDEWSVVRSEWLFIEAERVRRYQFAHRLYSGLELRRLMESVGFRVSLFGGLDGSEYGAVATRLVALGRKE